MSLPTATTATIPVTVTITTDTTTLVPSSLPQGSGALVVATIPETAVVSSHSGRANAANLKILIQEIQSLNLGEKTQLALEVIHGKTAVDKAIDSENNTLLHIAIMHGKLELMKRLLAQGADIICMNEAKESPLLLAFKFDVKNPNNEQICVEMLKHLKSLRLADNGDSNSVTKFFQDVQEALNEAIDINLLPGIWGSFWMDGVWGVLLKLILVDVNCFEYVCQIYAEYYQTMLVKFKTLSARDLQMYILLHHEEDRKIWEVSFIKKIYKIALALPEEALVDKVDGLEQQSVVDKNTIKDKDATIQAKEAMIQTKDKC